jgi:hypothetical protein
MRMDTRIWLGTHFIGDASREPETVELTVKEAALNIINTLGTQTLHKRIEFKVARTRSECLIGLTKKPVSEDSDFITALQNLMINEESPNEE